MIELMGGEEQVVAATKFKAAKTLSGEENATHEIPTDLNNDGMISVDDCPYQHGSIEAKMWVKKVLDPYVKNPDNIPAEYKEKYGDQVRGVYMGKPLVYGVKGSAEDPQADFNYMSDRIRVTEGVDKTIADRIAAKVLYRKFPGV